MSNGSEDFKNSTSRAQWLCSGIMGNAVTRSGEEEGTPPMAVAPSFATDVPAPPRRRAAAVRTERAKRAALRWEVEQTLRSAVRATFDDPHTHARLVEHLRLSTPRGSGAAEIQRALACAFSALPEPDLLLRGAATSPDSVALSAALALSLGCSMMEGALSGSSHAVDPAAQEDAPSSDGTGAPSNAPHTARDEWRCVCAMREPAQRTLWNETHPMGSVVSLRGTTLTVQCKREWAERERRRRYCAEHSAPDILYAADAGPTATYDLSEGNITVALDASSARVWSIAKKIGPARGRRAGAKDGVLATVVKFRHPVGEEHTARGAVALCQGVVAESDAARRDAAERKAAKNAGERVAPPRARAHAHTMRNHKRNLASQHASRTATAARAATWLPRHGRHSLHTFVRAQELIAASDEQLDNDLLSRCVISCTVTFRANPANDLTCPPSYIII